MKLLDCGHPESPHNEFTTGYGIDQNGKKSCYDCCLESEKESMRKNGTVFAYHGKPKTKPPIKHFETGTITNWPGGIISDRVLILSHCVDNFGGERTYLRFEFENEIWSGFSMGEGMYLRAKRTKLKELYS